MAVGRVEALLGGDGPGKVARATPAAALPPAAERLGTQLRACRQVCDVLMLPKADLLQAELRASICPDLTDRQVHWLLRAYQADELLDPASEVLAKLALEVSSTESPPPPALPTPVWGPPPSKADNDHELGSAAEPDFGTEEVAVDLVALQRYLTAVYANVSIPTLVPPLGPMALLPSAAPPLWD